MERFDIELILSNDVLGPMSHDTKIQNATVAWKKFDALDVRILEGLSLLGSRSLDLIASAIDVAKTTVWFRVQQMISNSQLFIHLETFYTNMGLKSVHVFIEASPGYEDDLLDCLKVNDFWIFLCRIYGSYEGCSGIWAIPRDNQKDFEAFLHRLHEEGVAKSMEIYWTTPYYAIPVRHRWFSVEEGGWTFIWEEWINEIETIEGELPYTLIDPTHWPILIDNIDLLIIKELEIDARASLMSISKKLMLPYSTIKYHFNHHVTNKTLLDGYNVEVYRFPILLSEFLFFIFEFDNYEKMVKFALSLLDKPFVIRIGKVLGENALIIHVFIPKIEFRRFIRFLTYLIKKTLLKQYHYFIQDMHQSWRQTIPYAYFKDGTWSYNHDSQIRELINRLNKL